MSKFALLALLFVSCFLLGKADVPVDLSLIETREINGEKIYFLKNKKEPYSGRSLGICDNCEKKVETYWKYGRKEGTSTHWYNNGQKSSEINFKNGKRNGLKTVWYENGLKKSESHWKEGKAHGVAIIYDENGKETLRRHYLNGVITLEHKSR